MREASFRYEGSDYFALRGVSIELSLGRIYGLIGPNGSGKSTLLRMMNGLIPHFYRGEMKGRVLVDGIDTREASVAQLARKVGLVFQNP
ncbi:MAG: ATP-binding cassette domain-containing protein, partial [Candidatus Korarchaeum sp.]|nr:ATP-binding cassette domain-containing protein [Candidatus Korarchaeum sp.]